MAGPATDGGASVSAGFGDEIGLLNSFGDGIEALAGGGGSIADCAVGALEGTTGSGNGAMASSVDAVSIVICTVGFRVVRRV